MIGRGWYSHFVVNVSLFDQYDRLSPTSEQSFCMITSYVASGISPVNKIVESLIDE